MVLGFLLGQLACSVPVFASQGAPPRPIRPQPQNVESSDGSEFFLSGKQRAPAADASASPGRKSTSLEQESAGDPASAGSRSSPVASTALGIVSVSRVVGEVGEQFVTSREVQLNDIIEQVAFGRLPGQPHVRVLKGTEKGFPIDVHNVLREWVIYLEAKSFDSAEVPKAELQKAIRAVLDAVVDIPEWRRLEASPQEVSEILERKLIAKKFLRLKTDSAQVPITDAEALAYFKKNRLKFGTLPFVSFRDNIKTFLIKQQMDRRLKDWIEVLERKYRVRNFIAG